MLARPRPDGAGAAWTVAGLVVVLLAFVIYSPLASRPFDIQDFSEFLPILTHNPSLGRRWVALNAYYVGEQGRFNIATYAVLALKWSWFGGTVVVWQALRFAEMVGLVALIWWLLRRLGASRLGATAGAALFIASESASLAWVRLTMGEPAGLVPILVAAHVAIGFRDAAAWGRRLTVLVALLLLAALFKETLIGVVPFIACLAACWGGADGWRAPRPDRRTVTLALVLAATGVGFVAVVLAVARAAPTAAFAQSYAGQGASLARLIALARRMGLPMRADAWGMDVATLADGAFLVLLVAGLAVRGRRSRSRWDAWLPIAMATGLVAIGAVMYSPWPYYLGFYGLPFLLGPSLLLALGVSALFEGAAPGVRLAVVVGVVAVLLPPAVEAQRMAAEAGARQQAVGALAGRLQQLAAADSILTAMPYRPQQPWQGRGPALRRYALATAAATALPPAADILCSEAGGRLRLHDAPGLLLSFSDACGSLPAPTFQVVVPYWNLRWPALARRDTAFVIQGVSLRQLMGPEVSPGVPTPHR